MWPRYGATGWRARRLVCSIPFLPNPLNPLFGGAGEDARWEASAFGYVLLALALAGALHAGRRAGYWALALLAFYLLSIGPLPQIGSQQVDWPLLPYNVLYELPFGKIPRTPVRFLFLANLCLAVLAAWGVAFITKRTERTPRPWPRWCVPAVLILVLIELWPGLRPTDLMSVDPFYERLARSSPGAVLELPRPLVARAMFWQTVHGHPILGGYFARYPPAALRNWSVPIVRQLWEGDRDRDGRALAEDRQVGQRLLIREAPGVLDAYGVRYVILHRNEPDSALLEVALRQSLPPNSVFWEDREVRAYRIPRDPRRTGVVLGFGLGWAKPQRQPRDPTFLYAAGDESELGLVLLDRGERIAELKAPMLVLRPGPIAVELNSVPVARLSWTPAPQTLTVRLRLRPGYNSLSLRALDAEPAVVRAIRLRLRAYPPLSCAETSLTFSISARSRFCTDPWKSHSSPIVRLSPSILVARLLGLSRG